MTSKLALFNDAMLILGQERLASLAEASTARYALDDTYVQTTRYCLEQGFWNFSMRAIQIDSSASVTPTFGYTFAFPKPPDFVRLLSMGADESMRTPLMDFVDEPNYWYASLDPLFVKYVSDDAAYGMDLSIWTETFTNYVAHRLAVRTSKRITGNYPNEDLKVDEKRAKADALSKDAMNEPIGQMPVGSWVASRGGNSRQSRWDRRS